MEASRSTKASRTTFVTERQAAVHALFVRHQSMSVVARMMGVSPITVRETLVQYQRNLLRDKGIKPAPLKSMLRGDVGSRFGVDRQGLGGRPALHEQVDPVAYAHPRTASSGDPTGRRSISAPVSGIARVIVTSAEPGAQIHLGFWRNLTAYALTIGAEVVILDIATRGRIHDREISAFVHDVPIDLECQVEIAADVKIGVRGSRPLANAEGRQAAVWTVFPHPVVQLETLPRVRADGLRVHLTSGSVTLPRDPAAQAGRSEVGAVLVELASDGIAQCRHLLAPSDGDGSFQDLNIRVLDGRIVRDCRVEALNIGDVHHAHMDEEVAAATWGIGAVAGEAVPLVDLLRPRQQIFHDLCDFSARSPWDRFDHLRRFSQFLEGGGDVRKELSLAAAFLAEARRSWGGCVVVHSNHDVLLARWLKETDFREDAENALFFLETSLALHRRLARGLGTDGIFEQTLRSLSDDGLRGVRFLKPGEGLKIAGIEMGIHGDRGPDGRKGGMAALERLNIMATIGHTHRPTARDGIYSAGVCQTELAYARGSLTSWAVGHVVTYWNGSRQHLLFHGGRFHL